MHHTDGHDSGDDTISTIVSSSVPCDPRHACECLKCSTLVFQIQQEQLTQQTRHHHSPMDCNNVRRCSAPGRSSNSSQGSRNGNYTQRRQVNQHQQQQHQQQQQQQQQGANQPTLLPCRLCISTQTPICRTTCTDCQCQVRTGGIDAITQVRPKRQLIPTCLSNDMCTVARTLEGHYCMLYKVMNTLRQQHAESMIGHQDIIGAIQNVVEVVMHQNQSIQPNRSTTKKRVELNSDEKMLKSVQLELREADELSETREQSDSVDDKNQCPDDCTTCNKVVKLLMAEIDELRRTRDVLLRVRNEANDIMEQVITSALASDRILIDDEDLEEEDFNEVNDEYLEDE